MIGLLALAAATAVQTPVAPRQPLAQQATATVRIISGARVTATEIPTDTQVKVMETRRPDGSRVASRIVEFP
ncbi:hypothetical protein H8M03_08755 [Sphingomonas sabuli]|uniref:Uncharacterized protein n=1 Tax=Sphingomonas sabuli TaxID=2764186 RepID=A0A7G9L0G7_9SPHN|nr:hypothetical protein [Sphingomonas sabuli]QNM82116.1 hypothetical protein H8M03_08755 [Sphingomonas sabuli]